MDWSNVIATTSFVCPLRTAHGTRCTVLHVPVLIARRSRADLDAG